MEPLALSLLALALTGFLLWLIGPHRSRLFAWVAATPPALITAWQVTQLQAAAQGAVLTANYPWAPSLGLEISLRLDGLALLFGLIITGIGTCIAFYAAYYFAEDKGQGLFYLLLFAFMASMLGLVWADNLLMLFVFWEGTSITSYLLIAFKTTSKDAVEGARRALIVTTMGGLAMFAGLVMLGQTAGSFSISQILTTPGLVDSPLYPAALLLLALGAFTKSAQFPFHFWLPGAMAAPTPASAYLHSATMVKAGVFLLARLHPALSDSPLWFWLLFVVGGYTLLLGSVSALRFTDMKALLAYATISQLGLFVMLLAFPGEAMVTVALVAIFAHVLYKAPLFLVAGIVDHAYGTRDLRKLAGLARELPLVGAVAVLAGLSMAGVPPLFGFLAKELMLEEGLHLGEAGDPAGWLLLAIFVIASIFSSASIFVLLWEGFFRRTPDEESAHLHHKPAAIFVLPALLLALAGAAAGFLTGFYQESLIASAAGAIHGAPVEVYLKLWHGLTVALGISLGIIALGLLMAWQRKSVRSLLAMPPAWLNGVRLYNGVVDGIYRLAYEVTKVIQGGPMGPQIAVSLLAAVTVMGAALWVLGNPAQLINLGGALPQGEELIIFVLAIIAAFATLIARSRLSAIISIGVVGVSVTLFFVIFSAPDLALTQLLIEVLTVVLLVLVFFRVQPDRLPAYSVGRRTLNIAVAVLMGLFGAAVVAFNNSFQVAPSISDYFLQNAYAIGKGTNVVNVILVDTRGYDTLGEITVLGLAALGGYAIMRSPQLHSLRNRLNVARERLSAANAPGGAGTAKPTTAKASASKASPEKPTHD